MMTVYKKTAVEAAKKAGALILKRSTLAKKLYFKGEINIVTDVDKLSEQIIFKTILASFPGHNLLSEESAPVCNPQSGFKWIIDPIDGTTNYAHNFPFYCVSIALEIDGTVRLGVIYNPVIDELFYAEKGKGAFVNGKRIRVSSCSNLNHAVLATGFPYTIRDHPEPHFRLFQTFCLNTLAVRRAGSAALDLCYTACGRFDGFWESSLHPWDVAAAQLILNEAGGKISDYSGNPYSIYGTKILATNGLIHAKMLKIIKKAYAKK